MKPNDTLIASLNCDFKIASSVDAILIASVNGATKIAPVTGDNIIYTIIQ